MDVNLKSVLIIGPYPDPITGQNLANKTVHNILVKENFRVNKIDMEFNRALDQSLGRFRWYKLKIFWAYLQIFKISRADVIYCSIGQSFLGILKFLPFLLLGSVLRKSKIAHLHGNALLSNYDSFSGMKRYLVKFSLKKFDKAIVLSETLRDNFKPFLKDEQIFVCHNFIDLSEPSFKNLKKERESKILFLSNLIPAKGIFPFLSAMKIVHQSRPNLNVIVAGTLSQDCPEVLDEMNDLSFVKYVGTVEGEKKSDLFQSADIFCLPTLNPNEGQPLAILEALQFGCCIVASDVPGISDVISYKNGDLLWPITDTAIAKSIIDMLDDKNRMFEIRENNLRYAREFSKKRFSHNILSLIFDEG